MAMHQNVDIVAQRLAGQGIGPFHLAKFLRPQAWSVLLHRNTEHVMGVDLESLEAVWIVL